jgi:hypothetical protein
MKGKGPLLTLIVGAVLAAVLLALSANAATRRDASNTAADAGAPGSAPATAPPSTAAPAVVGVVAGAYAGEVDGGGDASIALAVKDDHIVAYLCDGKRTEAWLQGTAAVGSVTLTGRNSTLTGTYDARGITGTVTAAGHRWTFTVHRVAKPSGLYRATAVVRKAAVVAGWIVLPGGRQVGIATVDGVPAAAPDLDVATGRATLDGTTLSATEVDGGRL